MIGITTHKETLVLNSDYNPITFAGWRRSVVLIIKGRAKVVSPRVIRLVNYVRLPPSKLLAGKPSKKAILKRDHHTCQYCGSFKNLTVDHIIPTSKGGTETRTNLVAACRPCNERKGDRTIAESGMILYTKPQPPFNRVSLIIKTSNVSEWRQYLWED